MAASLKVLEVIFIVAQPVLETICIAALISVQHNRELSISSHIQGLVVNR